jgi:hypothetical protein
VVRYRDREEGGDKNEQDKKGKPGPGLQVVKTLIGSLIPMRRFLEWE